jgi:hypothetical protein
MKESLGSLEGLGSLVVRIFSLLLPQKYGSD